MIPERAGNEPCHANARNGGLESRQAVATPLFSVHYPSADELTTVLGFLFLPLEESKLCMAGDGTVRLLYRVCSTPGIHSHHDVDMAAVFLCKLVSPLRPAAAAACRAYTTTGPLITDIMDLMAMHMHPSSRL